MADDTEAAYENLRSSQRQLDHDGCEVGVSRQALEHLLDAYNRLLATATVVKDKAIVLPINECGLRVAAGRDGTWLSFTAKNGQMASVNVEGMAGKGGIIGRALRDWCADRQQQATLFKAG